MKKRTVLITAIGIIVLVGIASALATRQSQAGAQPLPDHYEAAKKLPVAGKCLDTNPAVIIPAGSRDRLEMAAIMQLIDVPAGTNVDVDFASYTADEITGSDRYPAQFGNYNFVLSKHGNDWITTKFEHCD